MAFDFSLPPFTIRIFPRELRFKQPAGTSRGVYRTRRVWYVAVRSASPVLRFLGVGECAPLYDLSADYDASYEERLRQICREVESVGRLEPERLRAYPSMLFGLETAFLSARASLKGDPRLVFPSAFTDGERTLPINGLVWMGRVEEMTARLEEKLREGFSCVKLKIGAIGFDRELPLIEAVRARFGKDEITIRVDANGGFTPEEAPEVLSELARLDVHSIEQPLRAGLREETARLCRVSPVPIALDEELIGLFTREEKIAMLEEIAPNYIVLKPSLHGGLTGAAEWIELARERHIGYWITSALESNVGLNAIAQWTATLPEMREYHQGLGTGRLFVRNCESFPLEIIGERLRYGDEKRAAFLREIEAFQKEWSSLSLTMTVHTSGSTGRPQPLSVSKERMKASAEMTLCALDLRPGMTALLAMPLRYIAGKMVVVRSIIGGLQLIPVPPSSRPFAGLCVSPDFAALTPMQVIESLRRPRERRLLRGVKCLIIGGGAIPGDLAETLKTFPHAVYATYGMTETLSHVALRRLSGPKAENLYRPLPGVSLSLTDEGTLAIDAPRLHDGRLVTNDCVCFSEDGGFQVLGRRDNVVNSGGVKLQIESIEERLSSLGFPFYLTAVADERLGEALTMLYEGEKRSEAELKTACQKLVTPYETPRRYFHVEKLPLTATGKPARAEMRSRAAQILLEETLRI